MNDGQPSGDSLSPRAWLVGGCLAVLTLAVVGTAGGVLLARLLNGSHAQPAPIAEGKPPVATSAPSATATTRPSSVPAKIGTPTLVASADSELLLYYPISEWPGPPPEAQMVSLPPPVTDQEQLERAQRVYRQGKTAFDAEKWEEAIEHFDRALELDPRHAEAYNYRGAAYRHLGPHNYLDVFLRNNELAIVDFTRSIAADPTWWGPYNNRGVSYVNRAQVEPLRSQREQWIDLALADYAAAVELDPSQGWPRCNRASVYVGERDCARAQTEASLCNTWHREWLISVSYRCSGEHDKALQHISGALSADPDNVTYLWERGGVYFDMGEYSKALADYEAALASYGKQVPGTLWYEIAAAHYHLGHRDLALECIERGRPLTWIDWGQPYYYLGMILLEEGETEAAVEALQWAEMTLSEGDPLLEATRAELEKLPLPDQMGGAQAS